MNRRWGSAITGGLLVAALAGITLWLGRGGEQPPIERAAGRDPAGERVLSRESAPAESPAIGRAVPFDPARATALVRGADDFIEWPASAEAAQNLNAPAQSATEDIGIVETLFADYRKVYVENPLGGLNAEITAGLRGDNPRKIRFLADGPGRFNSEGELLDRWGTPYFLHKLSGRQMEVRSAGPDRRMGTADDVGETVADGPPL